LPGNCKLFSSSSRNVQSTTNIGTKGHFLRHQGKIEAYNKIVKNEFLALEDMLNIDDGKLRYEMFVKAYNEVREHGGINGLTPSEMFLQRLSISTIHTKNKQQSVTHVGN
jgi:transposase InsO family protein